MKDDSTIHLFMDRASYHRNPDVKDEMKKLNIKPIMNVAYSFKYNPCERLWALYKFHFRAILLEKMLQGPGVKGRPLLDALWETFKMVDVSDIIPKLIKKAMGMLRRDANVIRKENGENELSAF